MRLDAMHAGFVRGDGQRSGAGFCCASSAGEARGALPEMRISQKIRKTILFAVLVTFLVVATGAAMAIHLSYEHQEKHDSRHCHTCQQLFAINTNCMVAEHIFIADYAQFCDTVSFRIQTFSSISSNDSAEARAPPLRKLG
jgi:cytochrome b subunit of formate dehydrogenase